MTNLHYVTMILVLIAVFLQGTFGNSDSQSHTVCKCEENDIGIQYLCGTVTTDVDKCVALVVASFEQSASGFKRIRKQLSFNGAISSIANMLEGSNNRMRAENLRSRIRMMG